MIRHQRLQSFLARTYPPAFRHALRYAIVLVCSAALIPFAVFYYALDMPFMTAAIAGGIVVIYSLCFFLGIRLAIVIMGKGRFVCFVLVPFYVFLFAVIILWLIPQENFATLWTHPTLFHFNLFSGYFQLFGKVDEPSESTSKEELAETGTSGLVVSLDTLDHNQLEERRPEIEESLAADTETLDRLSDLKARLERVHVVRVEELTEAEVAQLRLEMDELDELDELLALSKGRPDVARDRQSMV